MIHVPKGATTDLNILPFDAALQGTDRKDYDCASWLYVPDFYSEYRYILGTRGDRPLICIGINPSTAEPDRLDPTLKSVSRIALANGYDSFLMFNLYAQRATDPDDMETELNAILHEENKKAFSYLLSLFDTRPAIWAAWGAIVEKRKYLLSCVRDFAVLAAPFDAAWFTAGNRSKHKGHPHHPLYLKKDERLSPFDVIDYLHSLGVSDEA